MMTLRLSLVLLFAAMATVQVVEGQNNETQVAAEDVPATMVTCDQEYALCAFANCTIADDLKTASCRCFSFDEQKAGRSVAIVGLIPDPTIQELTRDVCNTADSCGRRNANEAPLCDAIANDELWPMADLVSTYSTKRQNQNGVEFDDVTGEPLPTWSCPAAPGRLIPVCMLAPCVYAPEATGNPYNRGKSNIICTCPLQEATVDYEVIGGLQDPCSSEETMPGDYVTAGAGALVYELVFSEGLGQKWEDVYDASLEVAILAEATESPTTVEEDEGATDETDMIGVAETTESPTEGDGFGSLPVDTTAERTTLTRFECRNEQEGIIVGDIGDGAVFATDYICDSNGLAPIANIVLGNLGEGVLISVEGEVCCGPDANAGIVAQNPIQGEGFGGLPDGNDANRDPLSVDDCFANNGVIVGDIGNGAIYEVAYVCDSNGLAPIGNIIQSLEEGEPIAIEGSVCCGPDADATMAAVATQSPTEDQVDVVTFDYFTLDSAMGGCIGRKMDGSTELFLKECTSSDNTIQWRLDGQGRFRSKAGGKDNMCMQAGEVPLINDGVEALESGTPMYVKKCGNREGGLKQDFQVIDESFKTVGGLSGPIFLESRPDLCVHHFGARPVIGESRIMLLECASLGGERGLGWEADSPCTHEPDSEGCADRM